MLAPVLKQLKRTISISANRRGPTHDGGDVIIDHGLQDLNSILAHGVGDSLEFENDFAFRYTHAKILAYDHTIDPASAMGEKAHFFAEGAATYRQPPLDTVDAHIATNGLHDDNLMLKMDVEGAEREVLNANSEDTIQKFQQMIVDFRRDVQQRIKSNHEVLYGDPQSVDEYTDFFTSAAR